MLVYGKLLGLFLDLRYCRIFRVNDDFNRHQESKSRIPESLHLLLWCLVTAFSAVPSCGTDQSWWEGLDV